MDGGASFYIAMAAMAAGTAVQTIDTMNANKRREEILAQELRANELAALDEENERLIALRLANEEILAGAGGVDAWASPSLIAARNFNFEMGMQDIANLRYNIAGSRAGTSARIAILRENSRATQTAGILEIVGTAFSAMDARSQLAKTKMDPGVLSAQGNPMSPLPSKPSTLTVFGNPK